MLPEDQIRPGGSRAATDTDNDAGARLAAHADGDHDVGKVGHGAAHGPDSHGIFDERLRLFTDAFGDACDREGVIASVAIVADPAFPGRPILFVRGNEYDVAKLLAGALRHMTQRIMQNITP